MVAGVPPLPEISVSVAAGEDALPVPSIVHPHGAGVFLTFAAEPLYRFYEGKDLLGVRRGNRSADRRLLMKIGGGLILWAVIALLFFRWSAQEKRPRSGDYVGRFRT